MISYRKLVYILCYCRCRPSWIFLKRADLSPRSCTTDIKKYENTDICKTLITFLTHCVTRIESKHTVSKKYVVVIATRTSQDSQHHTEITNISRATNSEGGFFSSIKQIKAEKIPKKIKQQTQYLSTRLCRNDTTQSNKLSIPL